MGVPYCRSDTSAEAQIFGRSSMAKDHSLVKCVQDIYTYDADADADAKGHLLVRILANQKLAHYQPELFQRFTDRASTAIEVLRRTFIPPLSLEEALWSLLYDLE